MALVVIPAEGVVLCSRHDLNISPIQNFRFIWVSALRFHGDSVFIWKINKSSPMSVPGWWFRQERLCKTSAFKLLGRVDQSRKKSATIYLYLCKIVLVHVHAYTHTLYTHGWPGNGHCCWKFAANAPLKPTWVEYFQ